MTGARDENVSLAKIAGQVGRYDWMAEYMEKAVYAGEEKLTAEERNLLYTAFSKHMDAYREALRFFSSIDDHDNRVASIRSIIEGEMVGICRRVMNLMDSPKVAADDSKVFYLKMKGDCLRYLVEAKLALPGTDAAEAVLAEAALAAYKEAQDFAVAKLDPMHPIRLRLALNFSKFYCEILNLPDIGCNLAKQAIDEADAELKESAIMMKLLHDKLTLWNSVMQIDGDEVQEAPKHDDE